MTTRITILGAGPGGYIAAIRAAHLGAEVTVIENDNLGGTCLNWGCIPTKTIISSDEALLLDEVPAGVLIVGGGVVGAEFAFILSGLGSRVTVVEAMDRILPLPEIDGGISRILRREMKKRKIKFHLNKTVVAAQEAADGNMRATLGPSPFLTEVKEKDRIPVDMTVDKLLVCVGRAYNTTDIGLKRLGIDIDAKGWIPVNHRMETNISGVYAIGDVLGPQKIMLAHVASAEGLVVAENCLGAGRMMDYRVVPSGIFTFPEIGSVGLSEEQAKARGLNYRTDAFDFRGLGKSQAIGETAGQVKMISDPDSGKILGVHIIGPHATDLVAEAALAIKLNATVKDMAETIHLHPSMSEGLMEVAHAAMDAGLHVPPARK
jgi:dihydrolipoamide dehydrogenase